MLYKTYNLTFLLDEKPRQYLSYFLHALKGELKSFT